MNPSPLALFGGDWAKMARMLFRSWDIEGRRRWAFDHHKAHLRAKKWRRKGGRP